MCSAVPIGAGPGLFRSGAKLALELPMHVNMPPGAGSLMQRVDVLGDGQHIAMLPLKPHQRRCAALGFAALCQLRRRL